MRRTSENPSLMVSAKIKICEIHEYRNMIRAQVTRNLFGRYRNSILGFAWNFLTPMIYMVLSYIIFTEIKSNQMEDYIVFLSSGIFVYSFLVGGITSGSNLFTGNSGMIKKMYFPREILAISNAISGVIVASIGYVAVMMVTILTGHGLYWVAIPVTLLVVVLSFIFYVGCGLLLGSITVYVRDMHYLLGSISMAFFVCTPIRTSFETSTGLLRDIYTINPLTYFVEPMHQAYYLKEVPDFFMLEVATLLSLGILFLGYMVFLKLKRGFVERL